MRAFSIKATLPVLAVLGLLSSGAANAQGPDALISSCESCHGANGQTRSAATPRLNGQTSEYLTARLKELHNPIFETVSAIHSMIGPAREIGPRDLAAIVEHFSAQSPTSPNGADRARVAGAQLYAHGAGGRVPACASCHGETGQGIGAAPRLAGQHVSYLVDQMEALMITARLQPGMNKHAWGLMPEEIRALAAFLAND
jgi:cytochrome c553